MVRRDDLLKKAAEMARLEAKRRSLGEYALIAEATNIIDDLFMSITVEKAEGGVIKSIDIVTSWRHRVTSDMKSDLQNLHFTRADLQSAAERYLDRPWLHCRELDWDELKKSRDIGAVWDGIVYRLVEEKIRS